MLVPPLAGEMCERRTLEAFFWGPFSYSQGFRLSHWLSWEYNACKFINTKLAFRVLLSKMFVVQSVIKRKCIRRA
jgi:hypothetical protein